MSGFDSLPTTVLSRRRLFGLAGLGLAAGAAATLAQPSDADAWGLSWCWDDPIFLVNGMLLHINVGVEGDPALVRRHIENAHTVLYLPEGVKASVVGFTNNFFKETAEIRRMRNLSVSATNRTFTFGQVQFEAHVTFKSTRVFNSRVQYVSPSKNKTTNTGRTDSLTRIVAMVK